jgi:hypothetical protein
MSINHELVADVKVYIQFKDSDLVYAEYDENELCEKIRDENYFLSYLKNCNKIGFADKGSFLEVMDVDENNKYTLRFNIGENEKFIECLDFERMSYLIKCFCVNQIQNADEFKFAKTESKKKGSYGLILIISGFLMLLSGFFMIKFNFHADLTYHISFIGIILIYSGYLLMCLLDREIYLKGSLKIKYEDSPEIFIIVFSILSFLLLMIIIFFMKKIIF